MRKLANRVVVTTATTGTGTLTLGAALSASFLTFAEAGVPDGAEVSYLLTEGADFEIGRGVYAASGSTLTRDTVLVSKINSIAGTTKMTLGGSTEVRITPVAEDFPSIIASAVAVSHTGDTDETTLVTVPIPGGMLGPNGFVRIMSLWSFTSSASAKTLITKFGGTAYRQIAPTTNATSQDYCKIHNRNSESSQVGAAHTMGGGGIGQSSGAIRTSAVDTSAPFNITFAADLANAADTITLENYLIELFYRA